MSRPSNRHRSGHPRSARLAALALAASLGCAGEPPRDLLLRDVQIVDLERGEILSPWSIRIEEGSITAIGPVDELEGPAAEVIEGEGRFVLPGLIDAHVHVDHPRELPLYPAYGVTSVFVLRGVPHHLRWREQIRAGERFGPGLFLTGDYLDGYPATMEPMLALDGVEPARAAVRRQADAGYDFVKVYSRLTAEQLAAISEEADALGICVIGHAGRDYGIEELIEAGQDNVAHSSELLRWYLDGPDDEEGTERLVAALAASSVTVTPNLAFTDALIRQGRDLEAILATPEARRLPPPILQPFRRANNRYVRNADEWLPDVTERLVTQKTLARRMNDAGVTLLAGTDASTAALFPGDSLVREIELLADGGLSPVAALRTATVHPGRFLERCLSPEVRVGRLAPGYQADLLLVDGDPLRNLEALRQPVAVMLDGVWHARDELDRRLAELEADNASWAEEVIAFEQALFSGDAATARKIFDRVRTERPGEILFSQYVPFFVGYGFLYGEEGISTDAERLATARALYEMYAETYPDYHSAHYMLALAQRATGDAAGARVSLERALEIHPEYVNARKALAELRPAPLPAPR